jgi:hypothetical protein
MRSAGGSHESRAAKAGAGGDDLGRPALRRRPPARTAGGGMTTSTPANGRSVGPTFCATSPPVRTTRLRPCRTRDRTRPPGTSTRPTTTGPGCKRRSRRSRQAPHPARARRPQEPRPKYQRDFARNLLKRWPALWTSPTPMAWPPSKQCRYAYRCGGSGSLSMTFEGQARTGGFCGRCRSGPTGRRSSAPSSRSRNSTVKPPRRPAWVLFASVRALVR